MNDKHQLSPQRDYDTIGAGLPPQVIMTSIAQFIEYKNVLYIYIYDILRILYI